MTIRSTAHLLAIAALAASAAPSIPARGALRVGAARVDITPPADAALPMAGFANRVDGFRGIHDPIYVRAIVLDDGTTQAALVAWELLFVPDAVWADTSRQIAAETGIPADHLLMSAVHDHGAPTIGGAQAAEKTAVYTARVRRAAVEAVRRAKAQLQPATVGFGTAKAYVNINRREYFSPDRGWWLGYNDDGPSDKTVSVLRFDDLAGKPVAFWINYAVHAVVMGSDNYQITGDIAGATSRFVEQHFLGQDAPRSDAGPRIRIRPAERSAGEGPVVAWTSGTAGDQNPISMASAGGFALVDSLGKILGESVLRAASGMTMNGEAAIHGAQTTVSCLGRRVEPGPTPRKDYAFTDGDPVSLRLSLLAINDIAIAGVSGEVFTLIGQRLQRESRFRHTVMVTHTNGSSGYIPNDDAFKDISYGITASRLKPGCAEGAIVNGLLGLMRF